MITQNYIAGQILGCKDKADRRTPVYYYRGAVLVCNELGYIRPVNLVCEQETAKGYISVYFTTKSNQA